MTGAGLVRGLFPLAVAVYPFVVYFGIKVLPPSFLGLVLAALLACRFGVLQQTERAILFPLLAVFFAFAIVTVLLASQRFLMYYPVLMNFSFLVLFAWSLRSGDPMLLRIVRARRIRTSQYGPQYLYWLTVVWCGFFCMNGLIAAWTTTRSLETWTLYNGFISYLLIAALIGVEWLFRIFYKKRKGVTASDTGA